MIKRSVCGAGQFRNEDTYECEPCSFCCPGWAPIKECLQQGIQSGLACPYDKCKLPTQQYEQGGDPTYPGTMDVTTRSKYGLFYYDFRGDRFCDGCETFLTWSICVLKV